MAKRPRFLADHNVDGAIVESYSTKGYTVSTLEELGKSKLPDDDVLQLATKRNCTLLTFDKDFSPTYLDAEEAPQGVIYVRHPRPHQQGPDKLKHLEQFHQKVAQTQDDCDFRYKIIVVHVKDFTIHRKDGTRDTFPL